MHLEIAHDLMAWRQVGDFGKAAPIQMILNQHKIIKQEYPILDLTSLNLQLEGSSVRSVHG